MTPPARVFSLNDQLSFADLSGDYNPIHVNPVAARRLLSKIPIQECMSSVRSLKRQNVFRRSRSRPT